ncbi:MAG: glycosyltransferase family 4 protein [Methanobacteriota archaeon]|nr:MAG: glycosyltransferase family 4 protein [Euryarchaeota archaeon]
MSSSIRVLVVRPSRSSFIEEDIALLSKHFDVRTVDVFEKGRSIGNSAKVFFRLLRGTLWADVTYSWFAEIYALWAVRLSRLLLRKSIVIVGGYEVARIPEIGYGKLMDPKNARDVRRTLDRADVILTVSDGLKRDAVDNAGAKGDNFQTLPTCYDSGRFSPSGPKDAIVLTVALCDEAARVKVKGVDVFVEVANRIPHARFEAIGIGNAVKSTLADSAIENLELFSPLPLEEMIEHMRRAKVYCQLSMREGLPNALCEAMLCECVPVVSAVGAMPDVVGDAGFVVDRDDIDGVAEAVRKALVKDAGATARSRIMNRYSRAKREERLVNIIKGLVQKKRRGND